MKFHYEKLSKHPVEPWPHVCGGVRILSLPVF